MKLQMVDLHAQYEMIKAEIDLSIKETIQQTAFINGPAVKEFQQNLASYLNTNQVPSLAATPQY